VKLNVMLLPNDLKVRGGGVTERTTGDGVNARASSLRGSDASPAVVRRVERMALPQFFHEKGTVVKGTGMAAATARSAKTVNAFISCCKAIKL
jgi:hypothetical protein